MRPGIDQWELNWNHRESAPIQDRSVTVDIEWAFKDYTESGKTPVMREPTVRERRGPLWQSPVEDELISMKDLDYGRYKSMILRDRLDKKAISGYVYLPVNIWGAELTPLKRPVIGLAEAVKKYTRIEAKLDIHLPLSSPELDAYPFIYIGTDEEFELTDIERKSFSRYLKSGGFAVIDNCFPQERYGDAEASLRKMLRDAKTDIGSRALFQHYSAKSSCVSLVFRFRLRSAARRRITAGCNVHHEKKCPRQRIPYGSVS